ncbi:carbohydrate binding family 9 domain-containing protein [Aliiglaciecola lipolytica]|uniref:Uncharacterized protein n=1 Tax=Aliiglaciecola lipolytica E3 TaxID=1127673 RepID=K6XQG4_9ALTE|nr:carbohydrate binding family 9 domain-containing protein [Aliiglaciecola lipolytica]GAC13921.1 hypothetical protein GLIP_1280 [Aliiglaciecola lipolytica E3]
MKYSAFWGCALLFSTGAMCVSPALTLPQTVEPIVVDGLLDDSAWQNAPMTTLDYETNPSNNLAAQVKTQVQLLADSENIYVAFIAHDPQPSAIRAFMRDRDQGFNDDRVIFSLDTYATAEFALRFSVNAVGVQIDEIRNEANDEELSQWDATWQSTGRITEFGYVVEMAIPLHAVRFPDRLEQQWRINLERLYPRQQPYLLALNPRDRNASCEICQYSVLNALIEPAAKPNLTITPTMLFSQVEQYAYLDTLADKQQSQQLGVDLHWGVTPNISLNATLNPDFSQVESDAANLDINQKFNIKLDEKRNFFLEGADFFSTNMDLVHSRTIVDPDYGLKLTGKIEQHTFAILSANDQQSNLILPSSQNSEIEALLQDGRDVSNRSLLMRYQQQMANGLSLGTLLTDRRSEDGDYKNQVLSIDGMWQLNASDRLYGQIMRSTTEYPEEFQAEFVQTAELSDMAYLLKYERETQNWFHHAEFEEIGQDFRADSGFITRAGYRNYKVKSGHYWYGVDANWWSKIEWNFDYELTVDEQGQLLERQLESEFEIKGPWQSALELSAGTGDEVFDGVEYGLNSYSLEFSTQPFSGVELGASFEWGDDIDRDNARPAKKLESSLSAALNLGQHILLVATLEQETLDVAGGQLFSAKAQDVRLSYQFNNNNSIGLTYIAEAVDRDTALYLQAEQQREREDSFKLVYSYKLSPQTLFIAGFTHGRLDNDETKVQVDDSRAVFAKLSYAWQY